MSAGDFGDLRQWAVVVMLTAAGFAVGCGSSGLPPTQATTGKVLYKGGDVRALEGGTVEFQFVSDAYVISGGEIKADGTFTLTTWSKDGRVEVKGAAKGEHRVRVVPPRPDEPESRRLIDAKYQSFEKSGIRITLPTDKLIITVEKSRG